MSQNQEVVLPQYSEGEFASAKDCTMCSRLLGMRLISAWNSSLDPGTMNVRYECCYCHARKWDRVALPEVSNGSNKT